MSKVLLCNDNKQVKDSAEVIVRNILRKKITLFGCKLNAYVLEHNYMLTCNRSIEINRVGFRIFRNALNSFLMLADIPTFV